MRKRSMVFLNDTMSTIVEPCDACDRHVRSTETHCPFCGAAHGPPVAHPPPPRAPSRAAIAAWAGMFVAACGGAQQTEETNASGDGTNTTDQTNETTTANEEVNQEEESCAGRCGSHHQPACPTCPAPPYGAPPIDDTIV